MNISNAFYRVYDLFYQNGLERQVVFRGSLYLTNISFEP